MRAYFVLLILIVLAAGCVSPLDGGSGGPGVVINSLSFTPSNLKSSQLTKLTLAIENKGDYPIETDSGTIYLFNLPNDWEVTDKGDATTSPVYFSLLNPQKRGFKSYSGETTNFEWVLRAPKELPKDEIFSYDAQVRVCYPYKTKVWGRLEMLSENAWLRNPPAEHAIEFQQTNGPLKIEFVSKQPLMADTATAGVKIKVRVTNVGDGVVTTNECSIFSTVTDDSGTALSNLNRVTLGDTICQLGAGEGIYLEKGKSKETYITCTPDVAADSPITISDFTMELTYQYYLDKKATARVTGTSEDASAGTGIIGGGGGAVGTIALKDTCTKMCAATGQKPSSGNALGICATTNSDFVTYPGTSVDVQIAPLRSPDSIPSLGTGTATIRTLNLHDAKVSDLGLQSMKFGAFDKKAASIQYEKNTKLKTDIIGLVKNLCSAIPDGMKITNTYSKGSDCESQFNNNIQLGDLVTINGVSGDNFKDLSVAGLRITSILGRSISEITDGNLTEIIIEDFKLSSLSFPTNDFLKYVGCDSKNVVTPYADDVYCQCVIQVSAGYPKFDGTTSTECTAACTKVVSGVKWAAGGACDLNAHKGTSECSGTKVYDYKGGIMTITPDTCATSGKSCMCYDTRTVSSAESALLCAK